MSTPSSQLFVASICTEECGYHVWAVDGSLHNVASGRQTTQWTPGSSWLRAPSLSQLVASRCQTALINPNDPRGELIRFLIAPNDLKNYYHSNNESEYATQRVSRRDCTSFISEVR